MVERKSTGALSSVRKSNLSLNIDVPEKDEVAPTTWRRAELLSIADENNRGGDPYNSTGQLVKLPESEE